MSQGWKVALKKLFAGKWQRVATSAALVIGLVGATVLLLPDRHRIVVAEASGSYEFDTTKKDLGAALAAQGIEIGPKDRVEPSLDTKLKGAKEWKVSIKRAIPVTLVADGETRQVLTAADTVGEMLGEESVVLGPKDTVSAELEALVTKDMEIKIVRRTEKTTVERVEIPFDTVERADRGMWLGQRRTVQDGVPGEKEITRVTYFEDGQEVDSEVVEETVIQEPTDRVIAYGTMGVVSRSGRDYRYTRVLTMQATAYSPLEPGLSPYTRTGDLARPGVVAVDPNVIPLYSRVYVEGYGEATALDTGSAIKGNKIDLCVETVEEANRYGRQQVTVYVLDE